MAFMRKHRGWIALDIDGTITDKSHLIPPSVVYFLHDVYEKGWELAFITGRSYAFAIQALAAFRFPYYLALQNGADILFMPEQRLIARHYLDSGIICQIEELYAQLPEDFIIYAGYEKGDFCYYRPEKFSKRFLAHLHRIMPLSQTAWKAVDRFHFNATEKFPLIKCLGEKAAMYQLAEKITTLTQSASTPIADPLTQEGIFLNLVTDKSADKGRALLRITAELGQKGALIAAGDDFNDIAMLKVADFRIVMQTAPNCMHSLADYLAKPACQEGIIQAVQKGIEKWQT